MSQKYNSSYIDELEAFFIGRNDTINRYGNMISHFQALPGLVGLWYPGNVQRSTGNIYDYSGQGRTLTYNGNPVIGYNSNGVAYAKLDGTGDNWERGDETDLRITGTESWAETPGMTIYSWVSFDGLGSAEVIASKYIGVADGTFILRKLITNYIVFQVSDGTNLFSVSSGTTITAGSNYFVVGRYSPSNEIKVWSNSDTVINTTTIPASLNTSSTANFFLGARGSTGGVDPMTGKIYIVAYYASYHSDGMINSVFQQTRSLYGV